MADKDKTDETYVEAPEIAAEIKAALPTEILPGVTIVKVTVHVVKDAPKTSAS